MRLLKTALSVLIATSMLVLALPCNCMAQIESQTPKSERPCHSSTKDKAPDQNQHEGNCCCSICFCTTSSISFLESDTAAIFSSYKTSVESKITGVNPFLHSFSVLLLQKAALNGGSPPGLFHDALPSARTISILFQRWLI